MSNCCFEPGQAHPQKTYSLISMNVVSYIRVFMAALDVCKVNFQTFKMLLLSHESFAYYAGIKNKKV